MDLQQRNTIESGCCSGELRFPNEMPGRCAPIAMTAVVAPYSDTNFALDCFQRWCTRSERPHIPGAKARSCRSLNAGAEAPAYPKATANQLRNNANELAFSCSFQYRRLAGVFTQLYLQRFV